MGGEERIGTVLNDTYRLERLLGEGGMGTVYEAVHQRVPRHFAVKMLNPEILGNKEVFERFRREAEIASSLGSQHIVQVFDFNHAEDGSPYMVLELLEGHDLSQHISANGAMTLEQTKKLLEQATQALSKAHAAGIVHRDLKPANIYLAKVENQTDFVKILDFGISKVLHGNTGATRTGTVFGTPNYMSPEQAEGRQGEIDHRTDVFAMGAILYECLAGKMAFEAPTLVGTIYQVCHGTPQPIRSFAPHVPDAVEQVLSRAMAKQREHRQQDMATLQQEFEAAVTTGTAPTVGFAGGATIAAPPPTAAMAHAAAAGAPTTLSAASSEVTAPQTVPPKSNKAVGIAGVAIGVVGLAIGLWLALGKKGEPEAPTPVAATATAPATAEPAAPPPAPDAPKEAPKVSIQLQLTPADARVELDGVLTQENPLSLPRGNTRHKVTVSADGYKPVTQEIKALLDGKMIITLEKVAPKPAAQPAPKRRVRKPARKKKTVDLEEW